MSAVPIIDLTPWFDGDDAGRRRALVDQVASLTDASALAWHARFGG